MPHLRHLIALLLVMAGLTLAAQDFVTVSGVVTDQYTHHPLPHASVAADMVGTVTNEQGRFALKVDPQVRVLTISLFGYKSQQVPVPADGRDLDIRMQPSGVTLNEVVVHSVPAEDIVYQAISKFGSNYSQRAISHKGFYREVMQKRRQYISISEAVVELLKTAYDSYGTLSDAVTIRVGRRMMNFKSSDTLAVKLKGGPTLPIFADVVKNNEILFYPDDLPCYRYDYAGVETLGEREHYVIRMIPVKERPYALFYATLYIDRLTMAISRADLQLDMRNRGKASQTMLVHRPNGLRFTPLELTLNVFYRTQDGITYLNYVRNVLRFKCNWRRQLFASPFTVVSEFVVTDLLPEASPIRGRDSFSSHDNLYDNVEFFSEPDFWGADNVIEPTEALNRAVERLRRSVERAISN